MAVVVVVVVVGGRAGGEADGFGGASRVLTALLQRAVQIDRPWAVSPAGVCTHSGMHNEVFSRELRPVALCAMQ
jgi:hypothetical protein